MLPPTHIPKERRTWYKVRWLSNPYPDNEKWKDIEGKIDLMAEEDLKYYKDNVEILESIRVKKCDTGLSLRFGVTSEEKVDEWMKNHR